MRTIRDVIDKMDLSSYKFASDIDVFDIEYLLNALINTSVFNTNVELNDKNLEKFIEHMIRLLKHKTAWVAAEKYFNATKRLEASNEAKYKLTELIQYLSLENDYMKILITFFDDLDKITKF